MNQSSKIRIGIVGSGFIARGLSSLIRDDPQLKLSMVLTRRSADEVAGMFVPRGQITSSIQRLIDTSDLVIECSGDPIHGTEVASKALEARIPVVTMNSELQVTTGSWLQSKGTFVEAEGDQPGALAVLHKDVLGMGFKPLVYGNIKGFLNLNPTEADMIYWSGRSGISLQQVTAFTDGTKVQIEQVLVANGLGASIACRGLKGVDCNDYQDGGKVLAELAESMGVALSDYVLSPKSPPGVFIVASHHVDQAPFLRYYKLGDGPYYVLTRPFHLCHLEILKTVREVLAGAPILLNNGANPRYSVAAIAKHRLVPGQVIKRGMGGFDLRGEAVEIATNSNHLPIGLTFDLAIKRYVEPGQILTFDDVEVPETLAIMAWRDIINKKV